ncbi:MAG TPA: formate dehydrogenase accessory sulfurtransferase FdhD [Thermoanaerobaculia bacterium]|nr:formate dehydrogenase accessory sulfurtransferase FdhD [Thermoanaerobaculia bacterium]
MGDSDRTATIEVTRVAETSLDVTTDVVAVEEPLEILAAWRIGDEPREKTISVTMRTPGDDFDLAIGFLFTEGLLRAPEDVESVRHWSSPNRVRVAVKSRIDTSKLDRHFYTTSSCGVCGKTSMDAIRVAARPLPPRAPVSREVVHALPAALQNAQSGFHRTGGMHGAAITDAAGNALCVREDIGRHNAVDKAIGAFLRNGVLPQKDAILMVSSRGSFEIVQKAIVAGIGTVAFIGGPSSLAIELAREFHVTLLGFVRDGRFNVYSGTITP